MNQNDFKCLRCGTVYGEVVGLVLYVPRESNCLIIVTDGSRLRCPRCKAPRSFYQPKTQAVDNSSQVVLDKQSDTRE
jgi:pyruvate-formate lyase-activating enzyme